VNLVIPFAYSSLIISSFFGGKVGQNRHSKINLFDQRDKYFLPAAMFSDPNSVFEDKSRYPGSGSFFTSSSRSSQQSSAGFWQAFPPSRRNSAFRSSPALPQILPGGNSLEKTKPSPSSSSDLDAGKSEDLLPEK
jgi:hypothetical protein